ncbi:MAG: hypothetical protein A2Z25_08340 [Planctomycetes bacterium RBG_16_55_9]|nr:MAG: hypothetical protein A2Z25_08340 [Planctomycetes bacterium RBG_16_55_9]
MMCPKTIELIKEITLRNKHYIYRDGDNFRAVSVKKQGVEYVNIIPSENIQILNQLCQDKTVTKDKATIFFGANCDNLDLPYTYGHKLKYYVQDMLLILVAIGKATINKKGRGYLYHVSK